MTQVEGTKVQRRKRKYYGTYKTKSAGAPVIARIHLSMSTELLGKVDAAAKHDYTSRREVIRQAIVAYFHLKDHLKPEITPELVFKILQDRRVRAHFNEIFSKHNPANKLENNRV